jgi:hypothetical protein
MPCHERTHATPRFTRTVSSQNGFVFANNYFAMPPALRTPTAHLRRLPITRYEIASASPFKPA